MLQLDLQIAREEKKACMAWGQMLKEILDGVDGLGLEKWFREAAERIARDKRMHVGKATMLGWTFSREQRQILAYLFWEIFGAQASHNRKNRATSSALVERRKTRVREALPSDKAMFF
jgi:hypothetical protein